MLSPIVSVIIPTHNRSEYLRMALASVVAQTYRPIELIVVDDGSSEFIEEVVREVVGDQHEIQLIYFRQENSGPARARNYGLNVAHGEIIAFLDSDDLWYPEMLETTVSYLKENPEIDIVCGGWDIIDESGKAITGIFMPSGLQAKVDDDFTKALILKSLFPIHSVLTRRECFGRCGRFNTELSAFEDWDLWIRMAASGCKLVFIDVPVARWRRHSGLRRSKRVENFEIYVSQFFDNLFSYESIAKQFAYLQFHAEIQFWLREAIYYKNMNQYENMHRCILKAENLFRRAPLNDEILCSYEEFTSNLPEAHKFRQMVRLTMPPALRRKSDAKRIWYQMLEYRRDRTWLLFILYAFKIIFLYPDWVSLKIFNRLNHKFKYEINADSM